MTGDDELVENTPQDGGFKLGLSILATSFGVTLILITYHGIPILREEYSVGVLVGMIVLWTLIVNGPMITKEIDRRLLK